MRIGVPHFFCAIDPKRDTGQEQNLKTYSAGGPIHLTKLKANAMMGLNWHFPGIL